MSSDYYFYTEALVDGTWYGIDPRVLRLQHGDSGMTWQVNHTYWNGSRSYFGETFEKLEEISVPIKLEDTSAEFRMNKIMNWRGDDKDIAPYYDKALRVLPMEKLLALKPDKDTHEIHGIYHKDRIVLFEDGTLEDLYEEDISPEAYSALDAEAKRVYKYYEWDNPMSWRHYIPILISAVNARVAEFESVNYCDCDGVRVIMYECW